MSSKTISIKILSFRNDLIDLIGTSRLSRRSSRGKPFSGISRLSCQAVRSSPSSATFDMAPCAANWTLDGMNMDESSHYGILGRFYGFFEDSMGFNGHMMEYVAFLEDSMVKNWKNSSRRLFEKKTHTNNST